MILSTETYYDIISKIHKAKGQCVGLESQLAAEYCLPQNTISSIISNENKRNMKKNHYKMNNLILKLYDRYVSLRNAGAGPGIILHIAEEIDFSYSLLAKAILEVYCEQEDNLESNGSKNVKQWLKDSTLIEDKDLAYEIFLCQLYDSQYGCINDIIRHSLGQEYEFHLQEVIKQKNLSFQTEDDLRIYGYDKTPDIKLTIPFAVDGFVINWIESKALFGDPEEHHNYIKDQYSSYWNRFGTGLVIYWLGMVESIIDPTEKRFIVRDDFPETITLTDPLSIAKIPPEVEAHLKNREEKSL